MTDDTNYNYGYPVTDPKIIIQSSADTFNYPGLPDPPAGWGRKIGFTDSVDGDDEGPESPDEC